MSGHRHKASFAFALGAIVTGVTLGYPEPAAAHRLNVFASVDDHTLIVEAAFPSGRHPRQGTLTVFDADERVLHREDWKGEPEQHLAIPAAPPLIIEVEIDDGHYGRWTLPAP